MDIPYQHELDRNGSCSERDKLVVTCYEPSLTAIKYQWRKSTDQENKTLHVDYWITIDGKECGNDLKAIKYQNGRDWGPEPDDWKWLWIEFKGKYKRDGQWYSTNGWLYAKSLDIISFECDTYFLMVKREDLVKLCERIIDQKSKPVGKPANAIRKLYSRGADLMAKIHVDDVLNNIEYTIIPKVQL